MKHESKTVCILGSKGMIADSHKISASQFLKACGQNTGNLLFQYACTKIFADASLGNIGHDIPYRHDYVNGKHDYLVLPCANFINPNFDMSGLVDYLTKVRIPIIPLGLGAQFESSAANPPSLTRMPESIQKLIEIFNASSPLIFVRGEFTRDVLFKYGIDQDRIRVIGCPSNFIGDEDQIKTHFEKCSELRDADVNIMVTGDEVWPKDTDKRLVERKLVSILLERGGGYLVQSVEPLVENILTTKSCKISESFSMMLKHIGFEGTSQEVRSYLRLYDSVHSWMFGIRDISFSTGLRLHGNMCSLQCGIPSTWIYHDSRTEELCKTMSLPSMSLKSANEYLDDGTYISASRKASLEGLGPYLEKRSRLKSRFLKSLESLGIFLRIE